MATFYTIKNVGSGKFLNIYGSNFTPSTINGKEVKLWARDITSPEQLWETANNNISSAINNSYGIRVGTSNNCDISSSKATIVLESSGSNYKIKAGNQYLSIADNDNSDGAAVSWASSKSGNYQVWAITSLSSGNKSTPTTSTTTTCKVECSIYQGCTYSTHLNGAHKGVDISPVKSGVAGDSVTSILGGIATIGPTGSARGNYVTVKSPRYTIIYQHLDTVIVTNNASISAGYKIGTMGSSGGGTGVHLHVEVYDNFDKKYINYPDIVSAWACL